METTKRLLEGRVAIITGGAGGLARKFAEAMGGAGASVVLADVDIEHAEKAAGELNASGVRALAVNTDITSVASIENTVQQSIGRFGGIDILINNAAIVPMLSMRTPLSDFPTDVWDQLLRVNLTGALLFTLGVVSEMRKRGRGKILNIASGGAFPPTSAYGVSKLALVGLTALMSAELGKDNITVNAIAPGMISTDAGNRQRPPGHVESLAPRIPLKALGDPEDLVGAMLFLVSSASDWVTGQTINVDGGWIRRI